MVTPKSERGVFDEVENPSLSLSLSLSLHLHKMATVNECLPRVLERDLATASLAEELCVEPVIEVAEGPAARMHPDFEALDRDGEGVAPDISFSHTVLTGVVVLG